MACNYHISPIVDIDNIIFKHLEPVTVLKNIRLLNSYYRRFIEKHKKYSQFKDFYFNRDSMMFFAAEILSYGKEYRNFFKVCYYGYKHCAKYFLTKYHLNLHVANDFAFYCGCANGHLTLVKWLYKKGEKTNSKIDIHTHKEIAFRNSCIKGHLHIAKWLYDLGIRDQKPINVGIEDNDALWCACNGHLEVLKWLLETMDLQSVKVEPTIFKWTCLNGHLETAKWLFQYCLANNILMDFRMEQDLIFKESCKKNNVGIAEWLCTLADCYFIGIRNNKINDWVII